MKASGIDVIDLSVGEPVFRHQNISVRPEAAITAGKTKYTPAAGIPALLEAIAKTIRVDLVFQSHQHRLSFQMGRNTVFIISLQLS